MSRNQRLLLFSALQIVVGFGLLAIATVAQPIQPGIALGLPGVPISAQEPAGVAFWILLTLVGSGLASVRGAGAIVTFDLPFIAAATVLGGPVAGGWVAMIGSFELRELRVLARPVEPGSEAQIPWWGKVLANHALTTLPAVVAGVALLVVARVFDGIGWADAAGAGGNLVKTLVAAIVIVGLNDALAFETLALRSDRTLTDVLDDFGRDYWLMMVAEAVVAWLMIEVSVLAGWWAPVVCLAALLGVWSSRPRDERRDPLTDLLTGRDFSRRVEVLRKRRRGDRHIVVLHVELTNLQQLNWQLGRQGGDEVLKEVARRLRTGLRPLDDVARFEAGVFGSLLLLRTEHGAVATKDQAEQIAWRLLQRVMQCLEVDGQSITVDVAIGGAYERFEGQQASVDDYLASAKRAFAKAQLRDDRVVILPVEPLPEGGQQ